MKYVRLFVVTLCAAVMSVLLVAPANAAPPKQSGTANVATAAQPQFGSALGNDVNSLSTFSLGGKPYLVVSGDVYGYQKGARKNGASQLFILDRSGNFVWGASGISGGFIQTTETRSTNSGKLITLYLGGNFSRVAGQSRTHAAAYEIRLVNGRIQVRLSSTWKPSIPGTVRSISSGAGRIYVGASALTAVNPTTASKYWSVGFDCGVQATLYHDGAVYAGGLSRKAGSFKSHGSFKLSAKTGKVDKKYKPKIKDNRKQCTVRGAGHDSYSGANALDMAWDSVNKRVVECEGGFVNAVRSFTPGVGKTKWKHFQDGDAQTCTIVKGQVFVGFHRSKYPTPIKNYGKMGAFYNLKSGKQAKWALNPDFSGAGANRDHRNNGIIASTVFDGKLVVGGAFIKGPGGRGKLATFGIK